MRIGSGLTAVVTIICLTLTAAQATPAVWKEREFRFTYHGFTTSYSCEGLKHKVKVILAALGARANPQVRASGCEIGGGVAMSPRLHVRAAFPYLVPDDGVDGPVFAAQTDVVTLSPRSPRELENGDCELVEQLRHKVFAEIGSRVLLDRTTCTPHQVNLGRPYIQLEVLRATAGAEDSPDNL